MLASSLVLAGIALAIILYGASLECQAGPNPNGRNRNATIKPYWHRPGCYQVGHTRTISIPGCVKFNLSTNACRGYCMSFSIPAAEDIGPSPTDRREEPTDGQRSTTSWEPSLGLAASTQQQLMALLSRHNQMSEQEQQQAQLTGVFVTDKKNKKGELEELDGLNTFLHLSGQTRSPLTGTVGDTSDKRDVISVGQCCNMMETEDVTVNLRCGLNETRRLIFKSAKTCECFFCKHV